jgi:hypothetical protein
MAGDVVNVKVCSPLKLRSGLDRKLPRNLPLLIQFTVGGNSITTNEQQEK